VTHGGVEDAALAFVLGPAVRVSGALVVVAFEGGVIEDGEDVDLRAEVLEGVPFFLEGERVADLFETREGLVDDLVGADLLLAVADELGAEEANEGVGLIAVVSETLRSLHSFVVSVEGVGGGVRADETLSLIHISEPTRHG
jgi:hypothetical protein